MGGSVRLGMLYPGHAAEDDFPRLQAALAHPVTITVVHTSVGEDAHREDALLDLGRTDRLLEGVDVLRAQAVQAVVWACTSGSFVFGWQGAHRQVEPVADALGVPASSTSLAFVRALRALGIHRVAVAATYPAEVTARLEEFLAAGGVDVVGTASDGIVTAAEVGTLGRERVRRLVTDHDRPDAEAVVLPDTALHTVAWLEELEAAVGKPVLTANQVSVWEALRLTGSVTAQDGLGTLFRAPHAARR